MFDRLRQYRRWRTYRRRYPAAKISQRADLDNVTLEGVDVTIAAHANLKDVTAGSQVTIKHSSSLHTASLGDSVVLGPQTGLSDVTVGSYSYLAGWSTIHNTQFGRFCSVGKDLLCGLGEHPTDRISTSPVFYSTGEQCNTTFAEADTFAETSQVEIGSDVWIGARVFIRDGVRIGHGAVVAAGAVVVSDMPAYAVIAGVPGRMIRKRFTDDQIGRLLELQWWNWDAERLRAGRDRFASADVEAFLSWASGKGVL